jgi:hypothetical protein
VPPVGPSEDELREITAAANVLKNALTPLPKPPSGATFAPEIDKLIHDASRILVTVVSGQTVTQRIPEPGPGEADDPRLPPTGTQNGGGRCQENWQFYEEREEVVWNGTRGRRATGAMACVVSSNKDPRVKLNFNILGLDTSKKINRCHLIGHKLNGSNTDLRNFVPCHQDPTNNGWMYKEVEAAIAAQADSGNQVLMSTKPVYTANNPRPDWIVVNAVGENGWTCRAYIPNVNKLGAASSGIPFSGC